MLAGPLRLRAGRARFVFGCRPMRRLRRAFARSDVVDGWLACGGLSSACRRPSYLSLLAQRDVTQRNGLWDPPTLQALAIEVFGTCVTLPVTRTATPRRHRKLRVRKSKGVWSSLALRCAVFIPLREAARGGGSGPQGGWQGCQPVRRQHRMCCRRTPAAVRGPAGSKSRWARTQGAPLLVPFSRASEKMNPAAGRRAEPPSPKAAACEPATARRHSCQTFQTAVAQAEIQCLALRQARNASPEQRAITTLPEHAPTAKLAQCLSRWPGRAFTSRNPAWTGLLPDNSTMVSTSAWRCAGSPACAANRVRSIPAPRRPGGHR